jgi:hypothetical protein
VMTFLVIHFSTINMALTPHTRSDRIDVARYSRRYGIRKKTGNQSALIYSGHHAAPRGYG